MSNSTIFLEASKEWKNIDEETKGKYKHIAAEVAYIARSHDTYIHFSKCMVITEKAIASVCQRLNIRNIKYRDNKTSS